MRRVKVFKHEGRRRLPDGCARFHKWGRSYVEFESGPASFTTAVIERDDGKVETPPAHWIEFLPEADPGA